jgi:hypothetical protein
MEAIETIAFHHKPPQSRHHFLQLTSLFVGILRSPRAQSINSFRLYPRLPPPVAAGLFGSVTEGE